MADISHHQFITLLQKEQGSRTEETPALACENTKNRECPKTSQVAGSKRIANDLASQVFTQRTSSFADRQLLFAVSPPSR